MIIIENMRLTENSQDFKPWTTLLILIVVSFSISVATASNKKLNDKPIIAVLSQLVPGDKPQSYIGASYVKYLESAGARVVPILHTYSPKEVKDIFRYVNGVLFPGGGINWFTSPYYHHAKLFWDLAIEANKKGDYFPIWGTCLGFEAFHVIAADTLDVLSERKAEDISFPLTYTPDAAKSRMFGEMPKSLFKAIGSESVTYNHHKKGVAPETYDTNPSLSTFFHVLSTNEDTDGREFISTVAAFHYPFYGTQWHPEKNNFEFYTKNIPHSSNAIKTSQYLANFFVDEARKSSHKFKSKKLEEQYLIYNFKPSYSAIEFTGTLSHFEQIYLF